MGLLARCGLVSLALTAACYAPDTRDCTVKCSSLDDCAGDQVCSAGFCVASSDVQCAPPGGGSSGGGNHGTDAGGQAVMTDAGVDAPPDAPARGTLAVTVEGKGAIEIFGVGICDSSQNNGQCAYSVLLGTSLTAQANTGDDFELDRWTTIDVCPATHEPTCSFVPQLTTALGAKFRKAD